MWSVGLKGIRPLCREGSVADGLEKAAGALGVSSKELEGQRTTRADTIRERDRDRERLPIWGWVEVGAWEETAKS